MKEYILHQDLPLMCVTARSFPEGIGEAFDTLLSILPSSKDRTFFGISSPVKEGGMIYKAAVLQAFDGESEQYGCDTLILQKGKYLTETLKDWRKQEEMIGKTFRKLGDTEASIIPPGIEWYQGEDVMCMLRLDLSKV